MQLSIIIVSYNTKNLLKNCLDSIFKHTRSLGYEVIVVDNGSRDGSQEYLRDLERKRFRNIEKKKISKLLNSKSLNFYHSISLKVIFNDQNFGFTKANNQGIKQAKGKYVLLLNSDTLLKDNAFLKMVEFMEKHPEVSVLGPRLLNADGTKQASVGRFPTLPVIAVMLFKEHFAGSRFVRWSPDKTCEVDWVMGAAPMAKKEVFAKAGFLDEKIFMYMEEVEWCYRVKKAGFKIYFSPEAEITHLWQGSSRTGRKDPILHVYRGLVYFYQKHKSPAELAILRFLLKLKAVSAFLLGYLTGNNYLKETYGEALKIS